MFPLRACLVCAEWKDVWAVVNITRGKEVLVFSPKIKVFSKKKKKDFTSILSPISLLYSQKSRCSLKKKKIFQFDSLILDFLFSSRMLIQRKFVLPILTQCAAKLKYCAGVPSLLCGRAAAQLRGKYSQQQTFQRFDINNKDFSFRNQLFY